MATVEQVLDPIRRIQKRIVEEAGLDPHDIAVDGFQVNADGTFTCKEIIRDSDGKVHLLSDGKVSVRWRTLALPESIQDPADLAHLLINEGE